jgi:hypothetical protein
LQAPFLYPFHPFNLGTALSWELRQQTRMFHFRMVALVVLPESLGFKRIDEVTVAFEKWIRDYRAGADAGYGYPRSTVTGPNPSLHFSEQLRELDAVASAKGSCFAALSNQDKRAIILRAPSIRPSLRSGGYSLRRRSTCTTALW